MGDSSVMLNFAVGLLQALYICIWVMQIILFASIPL